MSAWLTESLSAQQLLPCVGSKRGTLRYVLEELKGLLVGSAGPAIVVLIRGDVHHEGQLTRDESVDE
jgi:hypothetical protein